MCVLGGGGHLGEALAVDGLAVHGHDHVPDKNLPPRPPPLLSGDRRRPRRSSAAGGAPPRLRGAIAAGVLEIRNGRREERRRDCAAPSPPACWRYGTGGGRSAAETAPSPPAGASVLAKAAAGAQTSPPPPLTRLGQPSRPRGPREPATTGRLVAGSSPASQNIGRRRKGTAAGQHPRRLRRHSATPSRPPPQRHGTISRPQHLRHRASPPSPFRALSKSRKTSTPPSPHAARHAAGMEAVSGFAGPLNRHVRGGAAARRPASKCAPLRRAASWRSGGETKIRCGEKGCAAGSCWERHIQSSLMLINPPPAPGLDCETASFYNILLLKYNLAGRQLRTLLLSCDGLPLRIDCASAARRQPAESRPGQREKRRRPAAPARGPGTQLSKTMSGGMTLQRAAYGERCGWHLDDQSALVFLGTLKIDADPDLGLFLGRW